MKQEVKKLPWIFIGLVIICVGLNFFLLPHDIASAGVGAIGHLLEQAFSIQRTITVWSINIFMLTLAAIFLGKHMFIKMFIGSLLFPFLLSQTPRVPIWYSYLGSLVIGSLLFSLGVYVLYSVGSSNGGITIPPIILNRHLNLPISFGLFLSNAIIILLNLWTFGLREALFVTVSILITTNSMKLYLFLRPLKIN